MPELRSVLRGAAWAEHLAAALARGPGDGGEWVARSGLALKRDRRSTAGLVNVAGTDCFIKFYRRREGWTGRLPLRDSRRALRSFDMGLALRAAGLATPEPLACVRIADGVLLVTRAVPEARALGEWYGAGHPSPAALVSCGELLGTLHAAGFSHGDCKWGNVLVTPAGPQLVDLDATRRGRRRGARGRDVARFTLDAEERGVPGPVFTGFLEAYLARAAITREELVAVTLPCLRRLRKRHSARYQRVGAALLEGT